MLTSKCKTIVTLVILFGNFGIHYCSQEMRQLPCPASLAKALINYTILPNRSLIHDQLTYSPDLYWTEDIKNITYGCICNVSEACTRKCCEAGKVLKENMCVESDTTEGSLSILRPWNQELEPELWWITKLEDAFHIVESMVVCLEGIHRIILDPAYPEDMFVLQKNGTLQVGLSSYSPAEYCLDWTDYTMNFSAVLCMRMSTDAIESAHPIGMLVSVIFLLTTFLVYAILPDLHNLHGKTLMCHMGSLIIGYTGLVILKFDFGYLMTNNVCILLAFIMYFSFLASFFWLNVMCFDIWWTFGGFRSLQGSVKQWERKKFIMYSVYAWGCASILTSVCLVMELVPDIPAYLIKPGFNTNKCWFHSETARGLYFYGPMGITVLCNLFLFISTALKISKHKRDTALHLRGSDSRRHNDNKQWFNLYLKLFIVMGINWSMEIISWLLDDKPNYVFYITDIANTLQGLIIFIIFVCKEKIKRLLLKRFDRKCSKILWGNSQSCYQSSARTCTTLNPLQEKSGAVLEEKYSKNTSESECM